LNELADAGNFDLITRRINGGTHGMADRINRWEHAKRVLNG
jgi:putative chitinase